MVTFTLVQAKHIPISVAHALRYARLAPSDLRIPALRAGRRTGVAYALQYQRLRWAINNSSE